MINKIRSIMVVTGVVFCAINNIYAYNSESLNKLHVMIHKEFIAKSTSTITELIKEEKPIELQFQKFVKTDDVMKKITQINHDGTGEFSVEVIDFSRDIQKELNEKEQELNNNLIKAVHYQDLSIAAIVFGLAFIVGGIATKNPVVGTVGGGLTLGGGYHTYKNSVKINTIPPHIKGVHIMEEDWRRSFEQQQKQNP